MKAKLLIVGLALLLLTLVLSSCTVRTCPTYSGTNVHTSSIKHVY